VGIRNLHGVYDVHVNIPNTYRMVQMRLARKQPNFNVPINKIHAAGSTHNQDEETIMSTIFRRSHIYTYILIPSVPN